MGHVCIDKMDVYICTLAVATHACINGIYIIYNFVGYIVK